MRCRCGEEFCYKCGHTYRNSKHENCTQSNFNNIHENIDYGLRNKNNNQVKFNERHNAKIEDKVRYWKKIGKHIPDHLKFLANGKNKK